MSQTFEWISPAKRDTGSNPVLTTKIKSYEKRKLLEWIFIRFLYWWNSMDNNVNFSYKRDLINSQVAEVVTLQFDTGITEGYGVAGSNPVLTTNKGIAQLIRAMLGASSPTKQGHRFESCFPYDKSNTLVDVHGCNS